MIIAPERVVQRVLSNVDASIGGCLISRYSIGSHGYAQIGWNEDGGRHVTVAHRVVWAAVHGPIPEGMTVDHMCKRRKCVNVDHLRLLPNFENARRTFGRDWPLGQCANGHPNSELIIERTGRIRCHACTLEAYQRNRDTINAARRARRARKVVAAA